MVATISYVSSGAGPERADYYLKQTQPEWERNQDLEYQLQHVPDYSGTVPIFQQNMPEQVAQAFRLNMAEMQRTPHEQLRNVFDGRRADGGPTGKREQASYTRQDGKAFTQKTYFDITVSNDISVGIALANSETPGGRALLYSAALDANAYAVDRLAERIGWTRQGAGGQGGEVRAHPLIVSFPHHAARPTQNGFVAPNLHFHNIVFSSVVTDTGRVGALWMMKFRNEAIVKVKYDYHDKLENNFKSLGIETKRQGGNSVIVADVPERLREFMAQRSQEILERATAEADKRGLNFNNLSPSHQAKFKQFAALNTRGRSDDGVTNTHGWRLHCVRLNYSANDLPKLIFRSINDMLATDLKRDLTRTWQHTQQATQQAKLRHEPLAFSVRARRQAVAATLALQLAMAKLQPSPAQQLKQQFTELHTIAINNKIVMQNKLTGRKLVRSLTPALVELKRMADTINDPFQNKDYRNAYELIVNGKPAPNPYQEGTQKYQAWDAGAQYGGEDRSEHNLGRMEPLQSLQAQPLQKDHDSLGSYMAQKHNLSSEYGSRIAAAGELVLNQQMSLGDATINAAGGRSHLQERMANAIADAATFYDATRPAQGFTLVGPYKAEGPVAFTASYGDAALLRDATAGKLTVVAGYTEANTQQAMHDWRASEPNREFIYVTSKDNAAAATSFKARTDAPERLAVSTPPDNAAGANTWQEYAKSYGTDAVASNMRQTYRQEFRQSAAQKMTTT